MGELGSELEPSSRQHATATVNDRVLAPSHINPNLSKI